ncbi:MAG: RimK family alpha-L-glutamate ligase [Nitrospirales bacterium]|nr:hypothetical protein [Nitrospirales bacterium]
MTGPASVLLIGSLKEPMLAYVNQKLARKNVSAVNLDFQQPHGACRISFKIGNCRTPPFLKVDSRTVPLETILSTYVRLSHQMTTASDEVERAEPILQHRALVPHLLNVLPGLVVNPYEEASGNRSKPYQQMLIAKLGFNVPKTLVTSHLEQAKEWFEACRGRVIYKSISSVRSVVRRLNPEDFSRLEHLRHCPVQFQEYIPGIDIRVHVVGTRVFASQIETRSTDYRYPDQESFRTIRALELPMDLQEKCVTLTEGLGLALAGIDLRKTVDGEYVCFEVNTSPAFPFYERHTGQRIGEALVEMLCRGTP